MFNKFVKKSSKFFAVLLTATLAFTPLSYAAAPITFAELGVAISDGAVTPQVIGLESSIEAETTDTTLGTQGATELTIKGDNYTISGAGHASGFETGEGQSATVVDTTFDTLRTAITLVAGGKLDVSTVIFNTNTTGTNGAAINNSGSALVSDSKFYENNAVTGGGAVYNAAGSTITITKTTFDENTAGNYGGAIYNKGDATITGSEFYGNYVDGATTSAGGAIFNSGDSKLAITESIFGENTSRIDGGALYNDGDATITDSKFYGNKAEGDGGAIYNASSGSLTINNSKFTENTANGAANDVYNDGELSFLSGTTTMDGGITGNGRTIINGGELIFGENAVLKQSYLEIGEGSSFAINVSSISITAQDTDPEIKNNGSLILSTGTVESFSSNITGTGTTTINLGANINMGYNSIEQSGLTVDEDSSLTAEIQNLKIQSTDNSGETPTATAGTITNNGTITLVVDSNRDFDLNIVSDEDKDGVLVFEISDSVSGGAAVTSNKDIRQSTITIGSNITYINSEDNTIETNYISGSTLENYGKLVLNLSEAASYGLEKLTGVGVSSITVTDNAQDETTLGIQGATIQQDRLEFYGDKTLRLDGSTNTRAVAQLPIIEADIYNYMTGDSLHLTYARQEGDFINTPDSVVYFEDDFSVSGKIVNNNGTINIVSSDFIVENGITSDEAYQSDISKNILNIGDSEHGAVVNSSTTISYQTITVSSGSLIMNNEDADGSITNSAITVAADGLLSVNPEKLADLTASITNDGIVEYYGGGEDLDYVLNTSSITATNEGILRINGNVQNDEAIGISKQNIEVLQTSTFTVNTNDMTDSKIENAGKVILFGLSEMTNETEITGLTDAESGDTVYGNLSIDTELTNNAKIDQNDIDVNIYVTNNAEINARGTLTNVLELDNTSAITAATLRNESNTGSIINESGATITATTKLFNMGNIDNTGNIAAENEAGDALLENDENATIKNNAAASISADSLTNKGAIVSSGSIVATSITNEKGGVIENYKTSEDEETYEGGTIDSKQQIQNKGTIISNANGMLAEIYNNGDGTEGSGVYNITGGTVTKNISGIDENYSTVNIQGDVLISSGSYIGQNRVNLEAGNTLKLEDETNLRTSELHIGEGSTFDINNDAISDVSIKGIYVADNITWNYNFDVNLQDQETDFLEETHFGEGSKMNIGIINVLADSDVGSRTNLKIADTFSNTDIQYASFATTQVSYSVEQLIGEGYDDATWLSIMGSGYGGLPIAVYDSFPLYLVTGDEEGNDKIEKWVEDEYGVHDTLKADLAINTREAGKTLIASPEDPDTSLTGLKTDKYTLKINNDEAAQELTIKNFENALTVDSTYGRLEANKVVFSSNTGTAVITNEGTTTLNAVTFNDNDVDFDIANNGNLVLTGTASTFEHGISGEGTTTISGIGIDMGDAILAQSRIEISDIEGSSLTVKVANLSTGTVTTSLIMNNGQLSLVGGEDEAAELNTEIKGIGDAALSNIIDVANNISQGNINILENAQITVGNTASLKASTITINTEATLKANADNIHTTTDGKIANNGSVEFTGGTNKNVIDGEGLLFISGDVVNSTGTKISQQFIEVREEAKLTMNANDVETATDDASGTNIFGIQNNGDLEITGGTNKNIIGRGDGINGNVTISGTVINEDGTTVDQVTIAVNEGASLQANATDLTTDNGITNAGELIFVGTDMTNNNEITGENGILTIDGKLENDNSISQKNINILEGSTVLTSSSVVASDKITNNGLFIINVVSEEEYTSGDESVKNNSVIDGTGELKLSSTTFATTASIKQSTITIADADSVLTGDINNIVVTEKIANEGLLTYTGEGINKNVIEGTGNLTIDGTIENSTGTAISQNAIAITNGNGFKTRADDVTTIEGIENNGTLTFIGGVNTSTITMLSDGEGILIVENDLTNQAVSINQKEINITGGDFENVRTSSITAESITVAAGSTLKTDALDLNISDSITITGTDTVLNLTDEEAAEIAASIMGSGKVVKEGEGTVTLSGENSYTGTTTISGGSIEILAANGISENTVYMDGGKLIINGTDEVSLTNEIMGTDHNDVNIEVTGSTTTLTGTIYGNKDLVKTGEGVLDLQMETNGYAGNTLISSGTVIGTTKNINGKVTGSGDEYSVVTFYDAEGDVVLNEIADMGTFNKTGGATMTVENAFKAIDANITSGIFIINNDSEMGGSGTSFVVDSSMTVTNAELRGYGDITVKDLIIGAGAKFAPGNSTTTFKVSGNLKFEEDGEYDVEFGQFDMDTEGHYNDNTQVGGTATIGENAKITLNNLEGKYYVYETIDLINASSMEDGEPYKEANVVFNDNDARDLREGYDTRISTRVFVEGNTLKIELQRKQSEYSEATEFDRSHNEQESANAIDAISTGNGGDITTPLDVMEQLYYYESTYDIEGLKAALNDIAGVVHSNATNLTFFNTKAEHVYDKIKERTQDVLPCKKAHDKVWGEYYYNNYSVEEDKNSPKHETTVNGFLVGFDMISANNLTLGVTAGYGTSELKQAEDKASMNDINLGFYGGYENEKWLLKGMLLGGYEQYTINRTIGFVDRTANSDHNGYSAALDLEAGYKISLNKKDSEAKHKMYLKPFIGVIGSYMSNEGYEEKNAESLNLKVEDYSAMTAEARAGLEVNGKVKKFGWYAKAGVRQLLTDKQNEIEVSLLDFKDETKMKIWSAENAQTTITGGLGVNYDLSENWNVFANGLGNFADVATNYYANVGLAYKFGCINNKKVTDEDVEKITAMLNDKITEEEALKKEIDEKDKELNDAKEREKELQNRIQKYEANVVSEQEAAKMKGKTIKTFKLGEKPTFVFGTDQLNSNGKTSLKQVATELENYPDAEVLVEGHTDNVGGDEVNQVISEKRAASVATSLKKDYGVRNSIAVIGKGKKEPIASNDTAEGRAKNRRVEITITTAD